MEPCCLKFCIASATIHPAGKLFCLPLQDVHQIRGIGTIPVIPVESGVLELDTMVTFAPVNITTEVKSVEMYHEALTGALPGDSVGLQCQERVCQKRSSWQPSGDGKNDPPMQAAVCVAQVTMLKHPGQIRAGYAPVLDDHIEHSACECAELKETDGCSGKKLEDGSKFLKSGDAAIVDNDC